MMTWFLWENNRNFGATCAAVSIVALFHSEAVQISRLADLARLISLFNGYDE